MPRTIRIAIVIVALPIAIVVWGSVVFAMDRASNGGEILGPVGVADVELGGLSEEAALEAVATLEQRLGALPVPVRIEGHEFELMPAEIGFDIDEATIVAGAMEVGRSGGILDQFSSWFDRFTGQDERIGLVTGFHRELLELVLDRWEIETIADPPFEGGVRVDGTDVVARYPHPGIAIDRDAAVELVATALVDLDRTPITIPTMFVVPTATDEQIDAAVAQAERLIAGPVILSRLAPEARVVFGVDVLASALRTTQEIIDGEQVIEIYFDDDTLLTHLLPVQRELEFPAQSAQLVARFDEEITVIPGRNALRVDVGAIAGAVLKAAQSVTRSGVIPYLDGEEPELTTDDVLALGVDGLLYRATTFFSCCGDQKNLNRIHNIQLIAEEVDNTLLMPGEVFSLNEHVGQRTEDTGYRRAGAIIGPKVDCCDHPANVGGGVSQFATTLYNAVFFSGLEDIEHTPHTLFFPRYPEVREATLGWPSPDVKFRNNTDNAILIDTETSDSHVTVRFYGNNGGLEVESQLGDRVDETEPFDVYEPNEEIPPGEEEVTSEGSPGWSNSVTRIITHPDGQETTQTWWWRYHPFPRIVEVHPCELPEDHEEYEEMDCPSVVPNVVGRKWANALADISNADLVAIEGEPVTDCSADDANRVLFQDLEPGEFVDMGASITIRRCLPPDDGGGG
jgi:vancomycin resistance protein YoaR